MVMHDYADIGIAVSSPKGLMVPVVRNAEQMALHEIEAEIKRLAIKARDGKIAIEDMEGVAYTLNFSPHVVYDSSSLFVNNSSQFFTIRSQS